MPIYPFTPIARRLGFFFIVAFVPCASVQAETLYLRATQAASGSWDSASWATTPTGTGTAGAPVSGNTYNTNGLVLRTPASPGVLSSTFAGDALVINGGGLYLKTNTVSIANLGVTSTGGLIQQTGGSVANIALNVAQFSVNGVTTVTSNGTSRSITLDVGTLSGSGDLVFGTDSATNTFFVSATTATAFTGTISLSKSALQFNNDLISDGGLNLSGTGVLTLNRNLTFNSVTIGGEDLAAGTYSFSYLNATFDTFFANGGFGSITVAPIPEPSSFALLVSVFTLGGALLRRKRR